MCASLAKFVKIIRNISRWFNIISIEKMQSHWFVTSSKTQLNHYEHLFVSIILNMTKAIYDIGIPTFNFMQARSMTS
jgi:hypothetical protein